MAEGCTHIHGYTILFSTSGPIHKEGTYGPNGPWRWIHEYKGDANGEGLLAFRIAFRLLVIIGTITCVSLMTYIMSEGHVC